MRQTGGRTNLLLHPQSAMRGLEPLRCCSPIIRAGFTAGQTNGQSLPVTERHPAVGRKFNKLRRLTAAFRFRSCRKFRYSLRRASSCVQRGSALWRVLLRLLTVMISGGTPGQVSCPGQDLNTLLQVVRVFVACVELWMLWATKKAGSLPPLWALSAFFL